MAAVIAALHYISIVMLYLNVSVQGFVQLEKYNEIMTDLRITIPKSGLYLVTVTVIPDSPFADTDVTLQVNNVSSAFTVYGRYDITAGITLPMYLKAGDQLSSHFSNEPRFDSNMCKLGVARISANSSEGKTYKTRRVKYGLYPKLISWNRVQEAALTWRTINAIDTIQVGQAGIYWLSARIDGTYSMTVSVRRHQSSRQPLTIFKVIVYVDKLAVSTSAAVYLWKGQSISLERPVGFPVGHHTYFSYVRFTKNTYHHIYDGSLYIAYTAYAFKDPVNRYVAFNHSVECNLGDFYDDHMRQWKIREPGVYAVSIRGVAAGRLSMRLFLMKGDEIIFRAYSDRNPSGQTGVFSFQKGDVLRIKLGTDFHAAEPESLMSIAFISPS